MTSAARWRLMLNSCYWVVPFHKGRFQPLLSKSKSESTRKRGLGVKIRNEIGPHCEYYQGVPVNESIALSEPPWINEGENIHFESKHQFPFLWNRKKSDCVSVWCQSDGVDPQRRNRSDSRVAAQRQQWKHGAEILHHNREIRARRAPRSLTVPLGPQLLAYNIPRTIRMLYQDQFNSIWSSTIYQAKCGLSRKSVHFSWSHSEYPGWFKIGHSGCWCSASQLKTLF